MSGLSSDGQINGKIDNTVYDDRKASISDFLNKSYFPDDIKIKKTPEGIEIEEYIRGRDIKDNDRSMCPQKIRIPDSIDGITVTSIGEFAFSEHRELIQVKIGAGVRKIGQHAFYNCRNLIRIELTDNVTEIFDGAFKNCYKLKEILIDKLNDNSKCLKGILSEVNNEVTVSLKYADGQAKLVFPYYILNYEENTPARIINQVTEGSGVQYRECVAGKDVDYQKYDRLFELARYIDLNESAYAIAYNRIRYPYKLMDKYRKEYTDYIKENRFSLIMRLAEKENFKDLKGLLALDIFSKEDLYKSCEQLRQGKYMESLLIVLDYQKEKYGTEKKKFEF